MASIDTSGISASHRDRTLWGVVAVWALLIVAFLAAPGSISAKAHALLHGVCAQRASHSLWLGGVALPMDARMTGIYLGAFVTMVWLLATGRMPAARFLRRPIITVLGAFVAIMGLDGFNALLADIGLFHLYQPSNVLRLLTGIACGVSLGVAACHVFSTAWWNGKRVDAKKILRPIDVVWPLSISVTLAVPALTGLGILLTPYTVGLVIAVVWVIWLVISAVVVVAIGEPRSMRVDRELAPAAIAAIGLTLTMIVGLAAARYAAERFLGLPHLT